MVVDGLNSLLQETKADMRGHCITELQDQKVASNRKAGFEWDQPTLCAGLKLGGITHSK